MVSPYATSVSRPSAGAGLLSSILEATPNRPVGTSRSGALMDAILRNTPNPASLLDQVLDETNRRRQAVAAAAADRERRSRRPRRGGRWPLGAVPLPRPLRVAADVLGALPIEDLVGALVPGDGSTHYVPPAGSTVEQNCGGDEIIGPTRIEYTSCSNPKTLTMANWLNIQNSNGIQTIGSNVRRWWSMWESATGISGDDHVSAVLARVYEHISPVGTPNPVFPRVDALDPLPAPLPGTFPTAQKMERLNEALSEVVSPPGARRAPAEKVLAVSTRAPSVLLRRRDPPSPPRWRWRRERKVYAWHPIVVAAIDAATEAADVIDALWSALPPECQSSKAFSVARPFRGSRRTDVKRYEPAAGQKLADLARCWDEVDLEAAIENLVANHVEDAIAGRVSGATSAAGAAGPSTGAVGLGSRI